ncbi:MAG: biotin/lipoyl-containing protein, partial [Betaproteobacteria bacterium]
MNASVIEIKVPDIGDFKEVSVIEVLVQPGDVIKPEQSLITVESDKASMEIPASHGGVVKELKVKLGDKVAEGTVVALLEGAGLDAAPAASSRAQATPEVATPAVAAASAFSGQADVQCDVLVLGGGPGGYSAAFR